MKLLDYECQTTFWEDFTVTEMFGEEAIRDTYKRAKAEWKTIVYTEQNCLWYLTINAGIGIVNLVLNLAISMANYMQSCGQNTIIGYLRIGKTTICIITYK